MSEGALRRYRQDHNINNKSFELADKLGIVLATDMRLKKWGKLVSFGL